MLTSSHLPNVIVWAVSRSRSTAFERAVMQHPGVKVLHEQLSEPFLARHFPAKHALIERNRQAAQGPAGITHYSQALALLSQRPAEPQHLQCAKEIAYFFDFQAIDGAWLTAFKHVFLVRQPLAVMQSLYRVSQGGGTTYFDADESGFDELARIHGLVLEHCPSDHVLYLDSDADLMETPRAHCCASAILPASSIPQGCWRGSRNRSRNGSFSRAGMMTPSARAGSPR